MHQTGKKTIIAAAVVVSGIALGALIGAVSGAAFASDTAKYRTNESGLTLGTIGEAEEIGAYPDLVLATATNGEEGYVYNTELEGEQPRSPEEAATWNETHGGARTITVYAEDGKTAIGEFVLEAAEVSYDEGAPREN